MHLEIFLGVPQNLRVRVAEIFYEAFETEFKEVFGPKEKGIRIVSKYLRNDRTVVAINKGALVGFAGLRFKGKGFIEISFWELLRELRFEILKMLIFGYFFVIFRRIWMFLNRPMEREMFVEVMAVTTEMRGKGIGSSLFRFIIDFGRSSGYDLIRVFVIDANTKAKRFLERIGFRKVKVHRIFFPWNRIFGCNATNEMVYIIRTASKREMA